MTERLLEELEASLRYFFKHEDIHGFVMVSSEMWKEMKIFNHQLTNHYIAMDRTTEMRCCRC